MNGLSQNSVRRVWLLLVAIAAVITALVLLPTAPALAAGPTSCPSSPTLTPGNQTTYENAVLYCGGTYSDKWTANGEQDWIAFYTTAKDASVVMTYAASTASSSVNGTFYDSSSNGSPGADQYGPDAGTSGSTVSQSFTFSDPGLHYVEMTADDNSTGAGYTLSLSGQWTQTAPVAPITTTTTTPTSTTPGPTTPVRHAAPSNRFTLSGTQVNFRRGYVGFAIRVPGAGSLAISGAGAHHVRWLSRVLHVSRAGLFTVRIKPNRTLLRDIRRYRRLSIFFYVTFTPRGTDDPRTGKTRPVTVRY